MVKNGMTMLEILVVLIIIVVIMAVSFPNFGKMQESAMDKEAFGNLKRIQEAEKFYNMETNQGVSYYYPSAVVSTSNLSSINLYLRIDLPSPANPNWNYSVKNTGCGQATRNGADNRIWHLEITDKGDAIPLPTGACP